MTNDAPIDCGAKYITREGFLETFHDHEEITKSIEINPVSDGDFASAAREDVAWLRSLPYWSEDVVIVGMVYHVETGKVEVVDEE